MILKLEEKMSWEFLTYPNVFPLTVQSTAPSPQESATVFEGGEFSRVCAHNKWAGINMLMFHVDVTLKQLKIRFKND